MAEKILVTRKEAAEMLSCSVDTIDDLCKIGKLKKRYLKDSMCPDTNRIYTSVPRILKSDVLDLISQKFGLRKENI